MHRRARHLNAGNAGATAYSDARYITGATDNTRSLTWSPAYWKDLSGSGNHIYGTNDAARDPIYIASSANINNLPVVRWIIPTFGNISSAYGNGSYTVTQNNLSVISVAAHAGGVTPRIVSFNKVALSDQATSGVSALMVNSGTFQSSKDSASLSNGTLTTNTPYLLSFVMDGTSIYNYRNKTKAGPLTISSTMDSNEVWFGTNRNVAGNDRWSGDLGCVAIFKSSLNDSLRLRIESAFAFRFKVAFG